MARDALSGAAPPEPVWLRPWTLVGVGLGLAVVALILLSLSVDGLDGLRLLVLAAALLTAAVAVQRRLSVGCADENARYEAAGLVAGAALVALLVAIAFGDAWNSGRMFAGVLTGVGLLGAVVVAATPPWRKLIASLVILFHFGGILTAVTTVDPGNSPPPWISVQAWGHVYRPYLGFLYLNNGYHFFAPEPGPSMLMWYHVEFASGKTQWVKMPNRNHERLPLRYMRLLVLGDSVNLPRGPNPDVAARIFSEQRRTKAGVLRAIPLHPDNSVRQYSEPQDFSKVLTSSYSRHVARTTINPDDPHDRVVRVKTYRVVHMILGPAQIGEVDPLEKTLYMPFFLGEFDAEGRNLSEEIRDPDGKIVKEKDPFLYWLIPIYRDLDNTSVVHDCLEIHAKSDPAKKSDESEELKP